MVKVGDRVRLTDKCKYLGKSYGYKVGDIGYIVSEKLQEDIVVKMENPKNSFTHLWCGASELEYAEKTPPEKITQNGYEYSLVGPVKPEWLVDGAWVVDKETGRKYRVSCDNGVYTFNNGTREVIIDFISLPTRFRPHEPKDWKWGDWAMYDGKRVFVMRGIDRDGDVAISGVGIGCTDTNYCFTKPDKLTPTF